MEKSWTKLFQAYIWDKRKVILMFLLYQLIFCAINGLYQFDNFNKLLYGVYISLFISISYGIWDFRKYLDRTGKLQEAYVNLENVQNIMPQPYDSKDENYQEIIKSIYNEMQQLLFKANLKETEMTDYYTLWAHQIKTPIAAMRLMLQNDDKEISTYAMQEELFKIEQYIEMVLHYLRLESMSSDMLLKEYELRDIVNQAVKRNAVLFINSRLSISIQEFKHTVVTDEKWLLFVIEQLITNAVKYTPSGIITIGLEKKDGCTWLVIEDTGIGIKAEDLPRIFEKGFTGYNGRLDKKSTGIGLYLCKQILDKLSHRIEVTSVLGKGTKAFIDVSERSL
ncbi:MAG: histidine kinase [Eubacterium sp.]|nr:histidine kinase [Eubacterium sp.]